MAQPMSNGHRPFDPVDALQPLIRGCKTWKDAQLAASNLVDVSMSGDEGGNMQFFKNMTQKVLPVFLYAAASMDEDLRRIDRWMNRINDKMTHSEIDSVLRWKENIEALDIWLGFLKRDQKLRGDIGATAQSVLQDIRTRGAWLGRNGALYTGSSWEPQDGAIWRRPALLNAAKVLRTMSDSRGRTLLARDVRLVTIGCNDEDVEGLRLALDAVFHDQSEDEAKRSISAGDRAVRVPVPRHGQITEAIMAQQGRASRPILVIVKPSPDAATASEELDRELEQIEEMKLTWLCPLIIVDLCQSAHELAYERDIAVVTHYLDGNVACNAGNSIEWTEPEFWTPDRWEPKVIEVDKVEVDEDEQSNEEADSRPADLALDTVPLTPAGQTLVRAIYNREGNGIPVMLLAHAVVASVYKAVDDDNAHEPLIVIGEDSGLILRRRHAPSLPALKAMLESNAEIAWARVAPEGASNATREVVASWLNTDERIIDDRQIGEVLMWGLDLSEYVVSDTPITAQVIVPTKRGQR